MKSSGILKNKKFLWILGILIVIILLALIQRKTIKDGGGSDTEVLSTQKVNFTGYSGHGTYNLDQDTRLETYKKVAQIEGKKANVDQKTMDAIINNAQSVDDLKYPSTGQIGGSSNADNINLNTYSEHMRKTFIYFSKTEGLKNGETIYLSVKDNSSNPFIKTGKKSYEVNSLKKPKTINISDFKSKINFKTKGTNGHGYPIITVGPQDPNELAHPTTQNDNYALGVNKVFGIDTQENEEPSQYFGLNRIRKTYSNGDKLEVSEQKLAKELNKQAPNDTYFIGKKGSKVSFKVKGLKTRHTNIDGIDTINKNLISEVKKHAHRNWTFVKVITTLNPNQRVESKDPDMPNNTDSYYFIYKDSKDKKYHIISYFAYVKDGQLYNADIMYKDDKVSDNKDELYGPFQREINSNKPSNDVLSKSNYYIVSKEVGENIPGYITEIN